MKSRLGMQIILVFLALAIGGFDRHLANYFPGEVEAMVQSGSLPAHGDFPVKSCDYHEDISTRIIYCTIPSPMVVADHDYRILHFSIHRISPHTMWQPPEKNA